MQYVVTGATGFIGRHLVGQLLEAGHSVVAIVRSPRRAELPGDVEIVQGDVTDKGSMREAMAGTDGVFHLAGWYQIGVDAPETAYRVNVEGTRHVLELMDELDVPKGVYTSTLAVFSDTGGASVDESYRYEGPHLTVYDRTKWLAHYEVAEPLIEEGLPLVIVMPGAVYGPGDRGPISRLWAAYLRGELPAIPADTGYCWGHVEDTAAAHVRAMRDGEPGEPYIVAGEPYTLVEVFDLAEQLTGIDAPRVVPAAIFRLLACAVRPIEPHVSLPPEYTAEALRVLGGVTYWGDSAKARRELGLAHRPFREGLEKTLLAERERIRR